ncbi:flagellar protein FlaG [Gammaproteobacteria bacterium]
MNISTIASTVANAMTPTPVQSTGAATNKGDSPEDSRQVQGAIKAANAEGGLALLLGVQDPKKTEGVNGLGIGGQGGTPPKKEQVEKAVSDVNKYIQKLRNREVQFSMDEHSGRMIIKVMDTETKKVITQFPPEVILRIADSLGKEKGLLMEEKA